MKYILRTSFILIALVIFSCFSLPLYPQTEIEASELVDSVMINDSLANYYSEKGNLKKAQEYALKNVAINSLMGKKSVIYAVALLKYARYLSPTNRKEDDEMSNEGLSILRDSLGPKSSTYTKYMLEYAWRQFNSNQILEACNTVKDVAEEKYDGDDFLGGYVYYSYSHFLKQANDTEMSIKYALKAKTFFENMQRIDDVYYLKTLTDLALLNISNRDVAINYLNKVKTTLEKNDGKNSIDYLDVLLNIAYVYRYNNKLEEALEYAKQAKVIGEELKHIEYGSYLYTLDFLAGRYASLKQYDDAIKYAEECLGLMKEANDFGLENRLPTLDSLIVYYGKIQIFEKVNSYAKEAYLIRKSTNSNTSQEDLVRNISYLLYSNYYLNKFEECEANVKELKVVLGIDFPTKYDHYYEDMNILANTYFYRHLYKEALETLDEMEINYRNQYGKEDNFLADILLYKANNYLYTNNLWNYHDYSQKALEIKKKVLGEFNKDYLKSLSECANVYNNVGFAKEAYDMFKQSALIAKKIYGTIHPLFVINYLSMMIFWQGEEVPGLDDYNPDDLLSFFRFHKIIHEIRDDRPNDVEIKMSSYKQILFSSLPQLLKKYQDEPSSMKILYDCILLLKSNHTEYQTIASLVSDDLSSDSQSLLSNLYTANKAYVNYQIDAEKEKLDILYNQIISLKDELVKLSPTFSKYFNKGTITADTLRNKMPEKSVIIDYIPLKQLSDSFSDLIVMFDKKNNAPQFISVYNAKEQISQIAEQYNYIYFLVDNDTILLNHGVDYDTSKYIAGYEESIDYIVNNEKRTQDIQRDSEAFKENLLLSRSEFEKGIDLYNRKLYSLAINAFLRSDSLMYLAKGAESNYYGHGMQWIGSCYFKMGQDSIAKQYSDYYNLPPIDMRLTIVSDSILDVAGLLYDKGNVESSLKKYLEASEIEKKNLGDYSYWYANTLSHCAGLYKELGDYEKAIKLETKALSIRVKSLGKDHIQYYESLKALFDLHLESGFRKELYYFGELESEYMEQHKDILGEVFYFYPLHTYVLAKYYAEDGNHDKSLEFCNKTIEAAKSLVSFSQIYKEIYHQIIMTLEIIGEDALAFDLCKQIIPIYEKDKDIQDDEIQSYSNIINAVANHYYNKGDFISASVYQEKALDYIKDKNSSLYGTTISNIALTYCELGRIEEAIKLAEEAVHQCEMDSLLMMNHDIYSKRIMNLAHCYSIANRPKDALRLGIHCYNSLKENLGLDNYLTMVAANNLALYYNILGYRDEVGKLLLLVVEHAEKEAKKNGSILGLAYNNLAMDWSRANSNYQESLYYINKAYEIRKNILGELDLETIHSLYNKGICLLDMGEISDGVDCIVKALSQTKDVIGENNLRYAYMMERLSYIYGNAGRLNEAIKIEEKRSKMLKEIVGVNHISFLQSLDNLSELYFYANDTVKLYNTIIDESNKYKEIVISEFPNYTSVERATIVNKMGRFFDWQFPLVCYYKKQPILCSELYNALLLRKGLLLNSEIEFSRLVRESGDSILVQRYNDLIANKNLLNKQYQLPVEQRIFDLDSLRHAIYEKEDYLITVSKEYGEYTQRFKTNWKDIRDKLNDDELSVEFVVFDDTCSYQKKIYFALVIDKHSENPILIPLCLESQIKKALNNESGLYSLIWGPILQERKNVETIFFSPSGILNNLGIEYLDINSKANISEKYNLYRLSSTRELIERKQFLCKTAALYGGLEYAVDTDVLLAQNTKSGSEVSTSVMYRGLSDSLSVRNSFEPLYNTKAEISEIGKTLEKGDVSVSTYTNTYGTEESFKALAGKGMNLIHLATHGMYIGAFEAESKKKDSNLSFIQIDDADRGIIQEDVSLTRSFLVMSGGDMLPSHKSIPDNLEDGILTATEISKLDLRGLDLVVLSACQTALGDVDNEGVYGLQRGFKKAGANTILMSLDKVDDEATKKLMVEFYKNLMSGKTKHQSLRDAQKHLRMVENGKFDKPEYWASFIMLDGLN